MGTPEVLDAGAYQRGKVIKINEPGWPSTIFYRDVSEHVRIRFADAWALETALLKDLMSKDVDEIHYYATDEKVLYRVTPKAFLTLGIPRLMNGRQQMFLPKRYWRRDVLWYSPGWVIDRRSVNVEKEGENE